MQKIISYICLMLPMVVLAQKKALIYTERDTISFSLVEIMGKLVLEYPSAQLKPPTFSKKHFLAIEGLVLEDADMVLKYQLNPLEAEFNYITSILLLDANQEAVAPLPFKAKGDLGSLPNGLAGTRSISWQDALEDLLLFGQSYQLVLSSEMWGPVNCAEKRPAFSLPQQLPHLAVAAGGLLLTGIGQFQKSKKIEAYDTYKSYHAQGESFELAQPFYEKAQQYEKEAKRFTYAGWAILSLDAAIYLYRVFNTKARQRNYDKYCQDASFSWQVRPVFPGKQSNGEMHLTLAFKIK